MPHIIRDIYHSNHHIQREECWARKNGVTFILVKLQFSETIFKSISSTQGSKITILFGVYHNAIAKTIPCIINTARPIFQRALCFLGILLFVWERVSSGSGCFWAPCVAQHGLELLIHLLLPPKWWPWQVCTSYMWWWESHSGPGVCQESALLSESHSTPPFDY